MIRHLIGGGSDRRMVLTECCLVEALPGSLVNDVADMDCPACRRSLIGRGVCPECGSKKLVWSAGLVKVNSVADGRLVMNDVASEFYLGCEECSETLINRVAADEVATALTRFGWRP